MAFYFVESIGHSARMKRRHSDNPPKEKHVLSRIMKDGRANEALVKKAYYGDQLWYVSDKVRHKLSPPFSLPAKIGQGPELVNLERDRGFAPYDIIPRTRYWALHWDITDDGVSQRLMKRLKSRLGWMKVIGNEWHIDSLSSIKVQAWMFRNVHGKGVYGLLQLMWKGDVSFKYLMWTLFGRTKMERSHSKRFDISSLKPNQRPEKWGWQTPSVIPWYDPEEFWRRMPEPREGDRMFSDKITKRVPWCARVMYRCMYSWDSHMEEEHQLIVMVKGYILAYLSSHDPDDGVAVCRRYERLMKFLHKRYNLAFTSFGRVVPEKQGMSVWETNPYIHGTGKDMSFDSLRRLCPDLYHDMFGRGEYAAETMRMILLAYAPPERVAREGVDIRERDRWRRTFNERKDS